MLNTGIVEAFFSVMVNMIVWFFPLRVSLQNNCHASIECDACATEAPNTIGGFDRRTESDRLQNQETHSIQNR
jgi:hypothetical protein